MKKKLAAGLAVCVMTFGLVGIASATYIDTVINFNGQTGLQLGALVEHIGMLRGAVTQPGG